MRYIINTEDEQGIIGIQIKKWVDENKISLIEKGDPVGLISAKLDKTQQALLVLRKSGYNSEVMKIYVQKKSGLAMRDIEAMMRGQEDFFKAIGLR